MHRSFVVVPLFLLFSFVCGAQTDQWSLELDAPAFSPTLYPDARNPTGAILATGTKLLRLAGDGSIVWSVDHERVLQTTPTAADLNNDGNVEIVAADDSGYVVVYDANGVRLWAHDFHTATGAFKQIVAADVHPNPDLELLIGFDDGWLNCLSADGDLLWRFFGDPFRVGGIAVGDATGDGFADIVYGTDNGNVFCLNGWGHVQWRYWEWAPYGRSGPNLADLDGDGVAEVLLTRSNQGSATCQMALDGRTGAFKWRAPTFMQGYTSNAIADLDGDGSLEVVHADKGNHLAATRADGMRMWDVELGGRGIFWAPAIADVDGDGQLDIITGIRGNDPNDEACVYRISADGRVLDRLTLGNDANTSPAIGDINGDGILDVLVAVNGPSRLVALSWGGDGDIAWPSLRGESTMRGASIAMGMPKTSGARPNVGSLDIQNSEPMYWGSHRLYTYWNDERLPEEGAFFTTSAPREHGTIEHRVTTIDRTNPAFSEYNIYLAGNERIDVTVSLHGANGEVLSRTSMRREPKLPDATWNSASEPVRELRVLGQNVGADLGRIDEYERKMTALAAKVVQSSKDAAAVETTAALVNELRALGDDFTSYRVRCAQIWRTGDAGVFAAWPDANPWDDVYGDMAGIPDEVSVLAYGDEFEDLALNLANLTNETIDVRCTFSEPVFDRRPNQEPDLAKRVTLQRAIPIPKRDGGFVLDALPELDRSGVITLPPGDTRQVWLVFDTHGLDAGEYELDLHIGSLTHPPTLRKIPIKLKVWQVRLPEGVYAQMNWGYIDRNNATDQDLQSMLDHGVNVANAPGLPLLPVDAQGRKNGEPDWTAFDDVLSRVPDYFQLMFHGAMSPQWPEGTDAAAIAAAEDTAFASGVQALSEHMLSLGWDYDRWAFYYLDEPWLTGLTVIPKLRAFCEKVRAADPRARLYANPTGKLKVEYLEEFKDLIDVWQPEINFLKRNPELRAWFQKNAKTLWAYEATDPGKELLPLGYYRSLGWIASDLKLSGVGFWVYKYHDLWWPLTVGNWAVVYPAGDEVVPSRRWEACRDGQEDYRAMYVLREEIQKAYDTNRIEDAERAERLLDEAVEKVVRWQVESIDEITRRTRDYELDYLLLMDYRTKIAEMIIDLRASGAHNPIHFLGD